MAFASVLHSVSMCSRDLVSSLQCEQIPHNSYIGMFVQ